MALLLLKALNLAPDLQPGDLGSCYPGTCGSRGRISNGRSEADNVWVPDPLERLLAPRAAETFLSIEYIHRNDVIIRTNIDVVS
jgi:hypothetical protein